MGRASEEARKRAFEDNGGSRRGGHLGVREGEQRVPPQEQVGGQQGAVQLEPTNLYNLNTFKFSGLANAKSVGIASGADGAVVTKSRPNNSSKPSAGVNKYTTKRNARKAMASIEKQLDGWRSDLVVAAKARMSVVQKGLRIKKGLGLNSGQR